MASVSERINPIVVSSRTAERVWFKQWMEDATKLFKLPPNWNGYGERPVHASALKRAARILDVMDYDGPPPSVAPRHDGSIQIEWHNGTRSVELIVKPNEAAEAWIFSDDDEDSWAITSTVDALRLRAAVTQITGTVAGPIRSDVTTPHHVTNLGAEPIVGFAVTNLAGGKVISHVGHYQG